MVFIARILNKKKVAAIVLALFLGISWLFSGSFVTFMNDATKADLSRHVSDKSCGVGASSEAEYHATCPGELRCFGSLSDEQIGANISGTRCVTPAYVEHHCGIYEGTISNLTLPPNIGCHPGTFSPSDYVTELLEEDNLYERIFNTNRNGTELIRSHGLELAAETEN